jgi:hypothetical protein
MPTLGVNPQAAIDKLWERNQAEAEKYLVAAPRYVHKAEVTEKDLVLSLGQGGTAIHLIVEPQPQYRFYIELAIALLGQ